MRIIFQKAIRLYQLILSPVVSALGGSCRFHPSCSEYAKRALATRPLLGAARLIVWRLMRCGPWTEGGIDHVPTIGK